MIKEINSTRSSQEDDYVRLDDDMERSAPIDPLHKQTEDQFEEDEEPPLISSVFAVDQLKQGAATAASLFSWGFSTAKEKVASLSETEQVQKLLESTKPQREAVSTTASQLWESTRPQREELSKTASSIGENMQPHLEKIKQESVRAFETMSSTVENMMGTSPSDSARNQMQPSSSSSGDNV